MCFWWEHVYDLTINGLANLALSHTQFGKPQEFLTFLYPMLVLYNDATFTLVSGYLE